MSGITLLVEDPIWRSHRGLQARLKQAAEAAAAAGRLKGGLTILLSDDRKLRALNREFRGRDKATNVLSFPAGDDRSFNERTAGRRAAPSLGDRTARLADAHAGDIAIAHGVAAKEAKAADKRFSDHVVHLVVHGVLHLAGYDHERPKDAKVMEPLEVRILGRLGIADPYLAMA
jgi:probable rRNA maturation factor